MTKARPVVHFEIRGRDPKRLQHFYRELFNWQISEGAVPGYALVEAGEGGPEQGVGGGIAQADAPGVSVYVQVANLAESIQRAEQLGAKKILDPVDVPGGPTIAQIQDPEGNLVGLVQQ